MILPRAVLAALAAALLAAAPASADTFSVTGTADESDPLPCTPAGAGAWNCSMLRAAINQANGNGVDDSILLTAGTYAIDSGELVFAEGATVAAVPGSVTLDGQGSRLASITSGAEVSMTGLTISGGDNALGPGGNLLVVAGSALNVLASRVTAGAATTGGGIMNGGALIVQDSVVDGNSAASAGGGIAVDPSASATTIVNSTIAANSAPNGAGISAVGGTGAELVLLHATIGRNLGPGIAQSGALASQAHGAIVASNSGADCTGLPFQSAVGNVESAAACGFTGPSNRQNADPGLAPALVATGGDMPTLVLPIPAGSPAVDLVVPCPYPYDQRHATRYLTAGQACDAGAYEESAAGPPPQPPPPPPPDPTPTPVPPVPTATPTPEPTPEFRETVVVEPVRGTVLVCPPPGRNCTPLRAGDDIPLGSTVDAKKGEVELTSLSSAGGKPQTARFKDGIFRVSQSKDITVLTLSEPLDCRNRRASAAQKKPKSRKLWGDGKGKFRTKGRYSAATIRGTRWLVTDTCSTTTTRVTHGAVDVRDEVKKRTFVVRKGKTYVARARP